MAFHNKVDYCGLSGIFNAALVIRDDNENKTNETYFPVGQDGSFVAGEVYGADSAPTNSYGVKANITATAGQVKLGKINTQDSNKYALESVSITTGAGQVPAVSGTCQQVESTATDGCLYSVPAFGLAKTQHAQILFSAFTLTGSGCELTACNANISCTVGKDKVAGVTIASDIGSGVVEVTATILQTGSTVPTVAADSANGWVISSPLTCTNPETAYKSYTVTVRKNLAKDAPAA